MTKSVSVVFAVAILLRLVCLQQVFCFSFSNHLNVVVNLVNGSENDHIIYQGDNDTDIVKINEACQAQDANESVNATLSDNKTFPRPRNLDVITLMEEVVFRCYLVENSNSPVSFPPPGENYETDITSSHVNVIVFNSTWKKNYSFPQENIGTTTTWLVRLRMNDFFHRMDEYTLPQTQTDLHTHIMLKWRMRLEVYHHMIGKTLHKEMIIIHQQSQHILRHRWGSPLPNISTAFIERFMTSSNVINVAYPCQTGCSIIIASNASQTYFSTSCHSFRHSKTLWYRWDCFFGNQSRCDDLTIHQGVLTADRLLLITSRGLLISDVIAATECRGYKERLWRWSKDGSSIDWNSAHFSFSPLCSNMDYLLPKRDVVLLIATLENRKKVVFASSDPFTTWVTYDKLTAPSSDDITATYDRQTGMVISLHTNSNISFARVHLQTELNTSLSAKATFPRHVFPSSCRGGPIRILHLSNHFFYSAIGACLSFSHDGGNSFKQIIQLEQNESAIQWAPFEIKKAFAMMTSRGRVYWGRVGVSSVKLIAENVNISRAMLSFDHVGNVIIINNQASGNTSPHVTPILLEKSFCTFCSYNLWAEPDLLHINFVQLKKVFVYNVIATREQDMPPMNQTLLSVNFGNPRLFQTSAKYFRLNSYRQQMRIKLHIHFLIQGISSVSVFLVGVDEYCPVASHDVIMVAGCPLSKRLHFDYSSFLTRGAALTVREYDVTNKTRDLLVELPINYRPPSSIAVAIPLSSNVYNVHPDSFNQTSFLTYQFAAKKKLKDFCKGASNRSSCSCNAALKFSSLEAHSDCKEKAYKVLYNMPYDVKLSILDDVMNDDDTGLDDLSTLYVYFVEVNGRDESVFQITDNTASQCSSNDHTLLCKARKSTPLMRHLTSARSNNIYKADSLSIKFLGSGLFHFRVRVVTGFSFCDFFDEFQAYVINPPLPFPTGPIIRLTVTVAMGMVLILIYVKYLCTQKFGEPESAMYDATPVVSSLMTRRLTSLMKQHPSSNEVHMSGNTRRRETVS